MVLQGFALLWFLYVMYKQLSNTTSKRHFYTKFLFCGLIWLLSQLCILLYF